MNAEAAGQKHNRYSLAFSINSSRWLALHVGPAPAAGHRCDVLCRRWLLQAQHAACLLTREDQRFMTPLHATACPPTFCAVCCCCPRLCTTRAPIPKARAAPAIFLALKCMLMILFKSLLAGCLESLAQGCGCCCSSCSLTATLTALLRLQDADAQSQGAGCSETALQRVSQSISRLSCALYCGFAAFLQLHWVSRPCSCNVDLLKLSRNMQMGQVEFAGRVGVKASPSSSQHYTLWPFFYVCTSTITECIVDLVLE